jgi:hypothetical protein
MAEDCCLDRDERGPLLPGDVKSLSHSCTGTGTKGHSLEGHETGTSENACVTVRTE